MVLYRRRKGSRTQGENREPRGYSCRVPLVKPHNVDAIDGGKKNNAIVQSLAGPFPFICVWTNGSAISVLIFEAAILRASPLPKMPPDPLILESLAKRQDPLRDHSQIVLARLRECRASTGSSGEQPWQWRDSGELSWCSRLWSPCGPDAASR